MNRIFLRDMNDERMNPELVRYFKYQNDYYLIYTFHEIDEKNMMTLYVVKIMNELEQPIAKNLANDWELHKMHVVLKQMLKEIKRHQIISFEDIDTTTIQDVKITSARNFKLLSPLVAILSGEYVEAPKSEMLSEKQILVEEFNEKSFVQSGINHNDKIQLLDTLKQKYQRNSKETKTDMNLDELSTTTQNEEDIDTMKDSDFLTTEKLDVSFDMDYYKKLQEENELLKQQLLQYQTKYQAMKNLLLKDE